MYKNEVDKPSPAKSGSKPQNLAGMHDFKGQAADQAYGQAGMSGCKADHSKIMSQHFKSYSDN